jgi:two-component system nitrate/nitrite response regulator NarL
MTLHVLVVSDVEVVRDGLQSVLAGQEEVNVVGSVGLLHARDHGAHLHPDVVLFDAGRHSSVDLVRELVASVPRSKVVAFGVKETEEEILALAAAGTAGYIRESVKSGEIAKALQRIVSNELTCSPRAAASLFHRIGTLSQRDNGAQGNNGSVDIGSSHVATPVPLSRRELQIAHLMDRGLTNKEIGRQLGIEATTVKNHVHNICEKLQVHRRGEATARIRAILGGHPALAPMPNSLSTPERARNQKPTARNGNHVGHPWAGVGQLGGVAIASAASEPKTPVAKL